MIELKNATIGYSTPLVEVENLKLEKGFLYGLIGANGKGKSTLIQSILGEVTLLSGNLLMDQLPFHPSLDKQKSKLFSFVSSRFAGIPHLTVLDYVLLGRTPYLGQFGQVSELDHTIAIEALRAIEAEHLKNKFTEEISDGERQMVAIARAMAQETPYLFLDEPTAFLDYRNKRRIMSLLLDFVRKKNKSVLVTSHDLEVLIQHVDSLYCIPDSKIQLQYIEKKNFNLESIIEQTFH
jgi:iron complex transport system ATP-binding protein